MVAPLVRATTGDATLNRRLRSEGLAPVNHKRVYRIMQAHNLLLARRYTERPEHVHDGKVIVMRSHLRSPAGLNQWRPLAHCSDGGRVANSDAYHPGYGVPMARLSTLRG